MFIKEKILLIRNTKIITIFLIIIDCILNYILKEKYHKYNLIAS